MFRRWLADRGQGPRAIDRLWDPIAVATLNAPSDRVATAAAAKVFRDGFFAPDGANVGLFMRSLGEVFDRARAYLDDRGGEARTDATAARILVEDAAVRGVELADEGIIECDAVVSAVAPDALRRILPDRSDVAEAVDRAMTLEWSPIVDVHVWFDRPVMDELFLIAVDAPIQTAFDVGSLHGTAGEGGYVVVSQSAAGNWMRRTNDEIGETVLDALCELLPSARDARCVRRRVIRHPRATFVPSSGSDALRPRAATPIDGLFLAGDWTATGWPSTIEGAIRSGIAASARVERRAEASVSPPS